MSIWSNFSLRKKILSVAGVFLSGMVISIAVAGYVLLKQVHLFESAVNLAATRIDAASAARVAILTMERSIQAVIAEDDSKQIRVAAISAIRNGATLDEAIESLKKSFANNADVSSLEEKLTQLRPKQMRIIGKARANNDTEALKQAAAVEQEFLDISNSAQALVAKAQENLTQNIIRTKQQSNKVISILGALFAGGVLIGIGISLAAANMMSKPLIQIERVITAMASGDLTKKMSLNKNGCDEIGRTILSLETTIEQLGKMLEKLTDSSKKVSSESGKVSLIADEFTSITTTIDNNIRTITGDSTQVDQTANTAIEQASNALDFAKITFDATSRSVERVQETLNNFDEFKKDMEQTSIQSRELANIVGNIQTITQTISGISEQTNLLALNAAIEAARAGDQGRGFAVVADEVRSLAGRTTAAVQEISALVGGITSSIDSTVNSLDKARTQVDENAELLQKASDESSTSLGQAKNISISMQEMLELLEAQKNVTSRIVCSIEELSNVARKNSSKANLLRNNSECLDQTSTELAEEVGFFKI